MISLGTWSARSTRYQRFLNLSNVFLLIVSTILLFSSAVLINFYHLTKLYFWSWYFYACPMCMLALGLYTFAVSVYGFLISNNESRGLISMIAVFLGIAFFVQIFSVFTAIELRYLIKTSPIPAGAVMKNMRLYERDESIRSSWDDMQRDLRCCGGVNYENGFQEWESVLQAKSVPDSCCHLERSGCGNRKIQQFTSENYFNLEIWKDGCLQILQVKMKNDVEPALMVYAGVGVLLAIVELITVVLACAFVAQLGRRRRRELGQWDRRVVADEYLPSLTSKETNF